MDQWKSFVKTLVEIDYTKFNSKFSSTFYNICRLMVRRTLLPVTFSSYVTSGENAQELVF